MRWLLLACALLVLTGCGASDPIASEDVSAAVEKTTSVGSSRISIASTEPEQDTSGEGVVDYSGRRGRISFRSESKSEDIESAEGEMLFVGTVGYMPTSMFGAPEEETENLKPWFSFDFAEAEPSLDSLVFPFPYIDPTLLLNALEEVSGEVESLGTNEVRGVETDGYRLEVDLRRAIDEAPAAHRDELLKELEYEDEKTLPIEVWIDGDGFARRVFFREGDEEVTLEFYDFGVEVDVEAPPSDQVADAGVFWEGEEVSGGPEELEDDEEVDGGMHEFGTDTVGEDE